MAVLPRCSVPCVVVGVFPQGTRPHPVPMQKPPPFTNDRSAEVAMFAALERTYHRCARELRATRKEQNEGAPQWRRLPVGESPTPGVLSICLGS
jgi:hypothetical protein